MNILTVENWIKGKLSKHILDGKEIGDNSDSYLNLVSDHISSNAFKQIRAYQKMTYWAIVNNNLGQFKHDFLLNIQNTIYENQYLQLEISKIEKCIESFNPDIYRDVLIEKKSHVLPFFIIGARTLKGYLSVDRRWDTISFTEEELFGNIENLDYESLFLKMHLLLLYKKWIEDFESGLFKYQNVGDRRFGYSSEAELNKSREVFKDLVKEKGDFHVFDPTEPYLLKEDIKGDLLSETWSVKLNKVKTNELIHLLYSELNDSYIDPVEFSEFELHFIENDNDKPFSKLNWKRKYHQLKWLFKKLIDNGILVNERIDKLLDSHFHFQGKPVNKNTLSQQTSRYPYFDEIEGIPDIIGKVEKLVLPID